MNQLYNIHNIQINKFTNAMLKMPVNNKKS